MRITIVNQFFPPDISPTGCLAASLAEDRASRGDTVTVIASEGYVAEANRDEKTCHPRIGIHRIWTPRLGKRTIFHRGLDYLLFYILATWAAVRLPRQDVVICLTTPPLIAGVGVVHTFLHPSTKLMLWNMDCYPEVAERAGIIRPDGWISRLFKTLNRHLSRRLDHIVCLDEAMRQLLHKRPRETEVATTVIPNWEPLSEFPIPETNTPSNLGKQPFTVLYSGNMGHGHSFDTLIETAELLARRKSNIQFVITGGGVQADAVQRMIEKRRLQNVRLVGYVATAELREIQRSASCALITLRDDMLGVMSPSKLHANLAMGLPIAYIGPAGSNVDDAIRQFDCGISLRHHDSESLVQFLEELAGCSLTHQRYAARARAAFEQAYCDEQTLPLLDDALGAMLSGNGARKQSLAA